MAVENNGQCISKQYINNTTKMKWMCKNNHTFKMTYGSVKQGKWCPDCSFGKTQKKLVKIIKDMFPGQLVFQNYKGFSWLRNKKTGGTQEIDIWVPHLKLAIEYDGQQHFYPVRFGGMPADRAEKIFKDTKRRDRRKNRLMKKHTKDIDYFIRFNYKEAVSKKYVACKLIKYGINERIYK